MTKRKWLPAAMILALAGTAGLAHAQGRAEAREGHERDREHGKTQVRADEIRPEQTGAERSYESRTEARIRELIHVGHHAATSEERKAVSDHWNRAARIWRIRHLAENAGDNATVSRCDTLLARADKILESQLKKLAEKAPVQVGGSK